jgi:cytoskeletal protein CcmA (bactofilin family)
MSSPIPSSGKSTVLTSDAEFKGQLAFGGELNLNGRLEGQVESEGGKLIIGDTAVVKAEVRVADIIIYGKIQGNIFATGKVELKGKAQVYGDIKCQTLTMEDGVVFVGRSEITSAKDASPADFNQIFTRLKDGKVVPK